MSLRLAFMGTPEFAVPCLLELIAAHHDIAAVYTRAPARAGRGLKRAESPIAREATERAIPHHAPASLNDPKQHALFAALNADVGVAAAYGLMVPPEILSLPRLGWLNLHPSLLPRWRGAAPIERSILAGDTQTGVTIMAMTSRLDAGDILLAESVPLGDRITAGELRDDLARLGASLMVRALGALERGALHSTPQDDESATRAPPIKKSETRLDWRQSAVELARRIRAFSPKPGAWFCVAGTGEAVRIRVLRGQAAPGSGDPGTVLPGTDDSLTIACGEGALQILEVQKAGGGVMSAAAFLRGFDLKAGVRLPESG